MQHSKAEEEPLLSYFRTAPLQLEKVEGSERWRCGFVRGRKAGVVCVCCKFYEYCTKTNLFYSYI
jgi:hypothetical protein